jgi:c-di-GMP-binding flagellar brake protein YcgR
MNSLYGGKERRKTKRIKVNFIVVYRVREPLELLMVVGRQEVDALMLDLSEDGMAVVTKYDIPQSTTLSIRFTLLNLSAERSNRVRSMEIVGEVRYNILAEKNEHRLGIYFTRISQEDKRAIRDFVNMTGE